MKSRHVIVVGGGASGLVAAITAAREGALVTIIEQKDRLGKKILSTGNGRCNLTNEYMESKCFRGDDTSIVPIVLEQFGYEETVRFFENLGILLKSRQGYIYPISDQATTVLDILKMEAARLKIEVRLEESVTSIHKNKKGFQIKTTKASYHGDAVILATGGKASPVLGSDGSGYKLAKECGHSLSPVVPALVQLKCKGNYFKQLSGIRTNAKVSLFVDGKFVDADTGELQLTNYGISGIPVFQISRYAAKALYFKKQVSVQIDFLPTMSLADLETYIASRTKDHGHKKMEAFLIGMFHQKLISVLLKEAKIPSELSAEKMKPDQWRTLIKTVKNFAVVVEGTNSFEQAQICAGGVRTSEIDPRTMESVYMRDLYLTGELLDVDGICGGYNLQWAWATGFLAGKHAAK